MPILTGRLRMAGSGPLDSSAGHRTVVKPTLAPVATCLVVPVPAITGPCPKGRPRELPPLPAGIRAPKFSAHPIPHPI